MTTWMLKLQPISPVLSSLFGLIIMKQMMKKHCIPHEKLMDMLTNSFLIILLTWKFAPAVLNPSWTLHSPKAALLTTGSMQHAIVGCVFASGYVLWQRKREPFSIRVLLDLLPFGIGSTLIVYYFFNPVYGFQTDLPWGMNVYDSKFSYHPLHLYEIIIIIILLVSLWVRKDKLGSGIYISYFLIGEGSARIILSFFYEQIPFFLGLSLEQWLGVMMISIGIFILPKNNKTFHIV